MSSDQIKPRTMPASITITLQMMQVSNTASPDCLEQYVIHDRQCQEDVGRDIPFYNNDVYFRRIWRTYESLTDAYNLPVQANMTVSHMLLHKMAINAKIFCVAM